MGRVKSKIRQALSPFFVPLEQDQFGLGKIECRPHPLTQQAMEGLRVQLSGRTEAASFV